MLKNSKPTLIFLIVLMTNACQTSGYKLKKAKLLDATMDPAKTAPSSASLASVPHGLWEKGATATSDAVQSSCPTCGS
jgi:hypothetical protein